MLLLIIAPLSAAPQPPPAALLSTPSGLLPSSPDVTLAPPGMYAQLGAALAAEDVDGDGVSDLIAGAPGLDLNTGAVYVHLGGAAGLPSLASATLPGPAAASFFGLALDGLGDTDGDGDGELITGAYMGGGGDGEVAIYDGDPSGAPVLRATLTGSARYGLFGGAVAGAGDVDGDGVPDAIIGAADAHGGDGEVTLHSGGANFAVLLTLPAQGSYSSFGSVLSRAGDVNADGYADFLVGAPGENGFRGGAHLYLGGASPSATPALSLSSGVSVQVGAEVRGVGDLDGDGFDDFAVASPYDGSCFGSLSLYAGGAALSDVPTATFTGASYACSYGVRTAAGDLDGDGDIDLLIGDNDGGGVYAGAAWVRYQTGGGFPAAPDQSFTGGVSGEEFGHAVIAADFNGDGYDDAAISASMAAGSGEIYVYNGGRDADGDGVDAASDCDDADPATGAGVTRCADADGDLHGDPGGCAETCGEIPGTVEDATDCDDGDAAINPAAPEVCDGIDNDCSGAADGYDATDTAPFERDLDGDSFTDPATRQITCEAPDGFLPATIADCDDANAAVHPGAPDAPGDGIDADCDGADPDPDPADSEPADSEPADSDPVDSAGPADSPDPDGAGTVEDDDKAEGRGCSAAGSAGGWPAIPAAVLWLAARTRDRRRCVTAL